MSQGESQRSRKTALKDVDPNRMPFEAAEALLWGRATYDQHGVLYKRMKDLEKQHESFEARIQSAESFTEAAKAAISRIRRIEERVQAIEDDDQDQPVMSWVTAELHPLKVFVHENKSLRQRQIDIEKSLADTSDRVDRAHQVSEDFTTLAQRVTNLETQRSNDADHIQRLENIVKSLTTTRNSDMAEGQVVHRNPSPRRIEQRKPLSPSRTTPQVDPILSDLAEEKEDEDLFAAQILPSSDSNRALRAILPSAKSSSTMAHVAQIRDKENMSARLRMMQRKSIHEPKRGPEIEPTQIRGDARGSIRTKADLQQVPNDIPATQIVSKTPQTTEQQTKIGLKRTPPTSPTRQLIVKLPASSSKPEQQQVSKLQALGSSERHEQQASKRQRLSDFKAPQASPTRQNRGQLTKQIPQDLVKRQPKNPAKRPVDMEPSSTRVTRSQARAQAQALPQRQHQTNTQMVLQPAATPGDVALSRSETKGGPASQLKTSVLSSRAPPAETQIVSEYASKRRKLNIEDRPSESRANGVVNRQNDVDPPGARTNIDEQLPRKKAISTKSQEIGETPRSTKKAMRSVRSPRKSLVPATTPRVKQKSIASSEMHNQRKSGAPVAENDMDLLIDDDEILEARAGKLRSPIKYGNRT